MRDVGTSAALAVAVALGLWPYLETVDFAPMALDSVLWISRGALHQPNWPEWTFWTRHFNVGYRPIAALSFTLTHAVAGLAVAAYRSTDLALHAANGLLVFAVVRRLAPGLPKWSAWLSASVFLMHPATEEVVPWLARRHYALATFFGLWAVLLLASSLAPGGSPRAAARRSIGSALCLGCALLSNEEAYTTAAVLPLLAWLLAPPGPQRWRSALRAVAPALAATGIALALRGLVVAGVGGYAPEDPEGQRVLLVFRAFWLDLLTFRAAYGAEARPVPAATVAALAAILLYFGWRCLAPLRRRRLQTEEILPAILAVWLVGASLLLALQKVWFPRELYVLLPAFSMLLGVVMGACANRFGHQPLRLTAHLVPQLALLGLLLLHSPAFRGPDAVRMRQWRESQRMLTELEAALEPVSEPALVLLAIPYDEGAIRFNPLRVRPQRRGPPRSVRVLSRWLTELHRERDVSIQDMISFPEHPGPEPAIRYARLDGRPALIFPDTREFSVRALRDEVTQARRDGVAVWLDAVSAEPGRRRYLYLRSKGRGELIELDEAPS